MNRQARERLRPAEEALHAQLADLKVDVAGKNLYTAAKLGSSLGRLKSAEEYARDRELSLRVLLKRIPSAQLLTVQVDALNREQCASSQPQPTPATLPLLLHQFFVDRLSQLLHQRHELLLRWARFAVGQPRTSEELGQDFQERLSHLLQEYNDALNRALRLAPAVDAHLNARSPPLSLVSQDDVAFYLRWLVHHMHCTKVLAAFIAGIQWLPLIHHRAFHAALKSSTGPVPQKGVDQAKAAKQALLTGSQTKWLSSSHQPPQTTQPSRLRSQSLYSQTSRLTGEGNSSMQSLYACTPRGGATTEHMTSHMTLPSSLGGPVGGVAGTAGLTPHSYSALPKHTTDVSQLKGLLQELMMTYSIGGPAMFRSSSEELQFHYDVSHRFGPVFEQQELQTTFHTYDCLPQGEEGGRKAKEKLTFKKPANWTTYRTIRPSPDPVQISAYVKIKESVVAIDPLLCLTSQCSYLHSTKRVLFALKQHSVTVKHPSTLTPLPVTPHKSSHDCLLVWKAIYLGLDTRGPMSGNGRDTSSRVSSGEVKGVGGAGVEEGGASCNDGSHSQDPAMEVDDAMKLIHDTSGRRVSSKAQDTPKDAYFGFLLLRHLRIRDMRNRVLSVLNYFRSLERTLTINCEGLSLAAGEEAVSMRKSGQLSHSHLFNTPADYVVDQAEFMQYMEVENRDDFYSFNGDGHVKVWDSKGVGVMYDAALDDLKKLEQELLTMATYYIQKAVCEVDRKPPASGAGANDLASYSGQSVDHFSVLLDLWSCEARYLECKTKVVNCYMEAYHHVSDKRERDRLAAVVVSLMAARPRHSPGSNYFTRSYEVEQECLTNLFRLLQSLVQFQLSRERDFNEKIGRHETGDHAPFGLPLPPIHKRLVSLSGDRKLLLHSYLLESSNSLCILASLPRAVQWSLSEVVNMCGVTEPLDVALLHCELLDVIMEEWERRPMLGASYTPELQQNLFAEVCAEDPHSAESILMSLTSQIKGEGDGSKQLQEQRMQAWSHVLEVVRLRHHLILALSDSQLLTQLYKQQMADLDMDECHAHLRCVSFDPTIRLPGDNDLEHFVSRAKEGNVDSRLDRFVPAHLHLAVSELDEKHMGRFSFRNTDTILQLFSASNGLDNLRTTVRAQVAQRAALQLACQVNALIQAHFEPPQAGIDRSQALEDTLSRASSVASHLQAPPIVSPTPGVNLSHDVSHQLMIKQLKKDIVSLQMEKLPIRDYILAQFTKLPPTIMRSQLEQEKAKCSLIGQFCSDLMVCLSHLSLRTQIIRCYSSLLSALNNFPSARDAYFIVGKPLEHSPTTERKTSHGAKLIKDPRQHRARPHAMLDWSGKALLNLWYIPHLTEIMRMFSELNLTEREEALRTVLNLVSSLHNIVHYICAYVRLGGSRRERGRGLGANWGGAEGVGPELHQLQLELGRLDNPTDPGKVSEYLWSRYRVLFLRHCLTVQYSVARTLLLSGNTAAVETLDSVSIPALAVLSQHPHPHASYPSLSVMPAPLDATTQESHDLFPWQHFLCTQGPFPGSLPQSWEVGPWVYTSLASLGPAERAVAHGELLGMSLLMEEVLQASSLATPSRVTHASTAVLSPPPKSHPPSGKRRSSVTPTIERPPSVSSLSSRDRLPRSRRGSIFGPVSLPSLELDVPPHKGSLLLEQFLTTCLEQEVLKREWGLRALGVHTVASADECLRLEVAYADKVLVWARKIAAKQQLRDLTRMQEEADAADTTSVTTFMTEELSEVSVESLEQAEGLPEMALRKTQVSCLLELLELDLIHEAEKHVAHLHHLLLSEKQRDDSTLPLDLWKKNSMKEITGVARSHVVDSFIAQLDSRMTQEGDRVILTKVHLTECIHELSSGIQAREKECYQLYASYYEALLRSQYNQLYLKNQEVEHCRYQSEETTQRSKEETLVFLGEQAHGLILEVTALRAYILELEQEADSKLAEAREHVRQEYCSLVDGLFSTSGAIKARFEDYRGKLYDDVLQSVHEVRQTAAANISRMKEKLGLVQSESSVAMVAGLESHGVKEIQQENAQLNKSMMKMTSMNNWRKFKDHSSYSRELLSLHEDLNAAQTQSLALKMTSEQKICALEQQVKTLQKSLAQVERQCEIAKQHLEEQRQQHSTASKGSDKPHGSSTSKASREQASKLDKLMHDLDDREKQLRDLTASQDRSRRLVTTERNHTARALHHMQQQLQHERTLKRTAFHQVDDLLEQTHDQEVRQHASLQASLHALRRNTAGSARSAPSTAQLPPSTESGKLPPSKVKRPKSQQGRLRTPSNSETIDLSQEIMALKLI